MIRGLRGPKAEPSPVSRWRWFALRSVAWVGLVVLGCACSLDPTESLASRLEVGWSLVRAGAPSSCAEAAVELVEVRTELIGDPDDNPAGRPDAAAELLAERFPCPSGAGRTRPLDPGRYRVTLRAIGESDQILGVSAVIEASLAPRQTAELAAVPIDLGDRGPGAAPAGQAGALPGGPSEPTF